MRPHTLADRLRLVLDVMARLGVDRIVCAGNGHHMIDLSNPVAHLTGRRSIGPAILAIENDGRCRLLSGAASDAGLDLGGCPIDEHRAAEDVAFAVGDFLAPSGRATASVGLHQMPRHLAAAVVAAIGSEPRAIDSEVYGATARKTDDELTAARVATRIAEAGYAHMLRVAQPGRKECDVAVEVNMVMREQGANDSFLMLNCGARADAVMPSSERRIEAGDLLLCELSPSVEGQFTQICRTVSIGAPAATLRKGYDLLIAAMHEGIGKVRPGVPLGTVCAAIDDYLSDAGYAQFSRPPFIRRRGHGLGCGSGAPGDVSVDNETMLVPGMLFMVHPNQFLPETGYMMCGEPVLVTETGHEVLTASRAALAIAAPGRS